MTTPIIDYLNKTHIKWMPIGLSVENGLKSIADHTHPLHAHASYRGRPAYTEFRSMDDGLLKARQNLIELTDYIAIDTSEIPQIDVDTSDHADDIDAWAFNTPHYVSVSKGLPHMFVKTDTQLNKEKYVFTDEDVNGEHKIDFLCGQWAWAHKDAVVQNADKEIYNLGNISNRLYGYVQKSPTASTQSNGASEGSVRTSLPLALRSDEPVNEMQKWYELLAIIDNTNQKIPYHEWFKIGTCMKYNGFTIDDFVKFTNDPNKIDKTKKQWNDDMRDIGISLEFLQKHAKSSNIDAYQNWKRKWNKHITPEIIKKGSNDICIFMTPILRQYLIYSDKQWWYCNKTSHIWECLAEPTSLIVTAIQSEIDELAAINSKTLMLLRMTGENKDAIVACEKIEKEVVTWRKQISSNGETAMYKKLLQSYLADDKFYKKLNCTINKIVFSDGIYDLETGVFKKGFDTYDFISESLEYPYQTPDKEKQNILMQQFLKICNYNVKHRDYYLSILGYALTGNSSLVQEFYYLRGQKACNGKSVIFEALTKIAPLYVGKMDNTALEANNQMRHKQIAKWLGKRIMWVNELNQKKQDAEMLKEVADGQQMSYNKMYANAEMMLILFKLFVISNHTIDITMDKGIIRRMKVLQMDSEFKNNISVDDYENKIFMANDKFPDELITIYKYELLHILFDYAKQFYDDKKKIKPYPDDWEAEKQQCIQTTDDFDMWFNEYIEVGDKYTISKYALKKLMERDRHGNVKIGDYAKRKGIKINGSSNNWMGIRERVHCYTEQNSLKDEDNDEGSVATEPL